MYANQVIDVLTRKKANYAGYGAVDLIPLTVTRIQQAIKFHVGDFRNTSALKFADTLEGALHPAPKMPYAWTWIDGVVNSQQEKYVSFSLHKQAFLIYGDGDSLFINLFWCFDNADNWILSPISILISANGVIQPAYLDGVLEKDREKEDVQLVVDEIYAVYFFAEVLQCKNISTETIVPPAKLNKSRVKKGKLPLYEYKVLVVNPTTARQKYLFAQSNHAAPRVHLCRGHFKEYTADKPLLGKHVGKYWWQPCVRGDKSAGMIEKEYLVKTL